MKRAELKFSLWSRPNEPNSTSESALTAHNLIICLYYYSPHNSWSTSVSFLSMIPDLSKLNQQVSVLLLLMVMVAKITKTRPRLYKTEFHFKYDHLCTHNINPYEIIDICIYSHTHTHFFPRIKPQMSSFRAHKNMDD